MIFQDYTFLDIYYILIITFIGMCMGSFLNCLAYRMCHGLSIVKGRSMCDKCEHVLGPLDLVPVFSYIFSHGKCRYCGEKLSIRYPLSELISGLVYLVVYLKFGLTIYTIEYLILVSLMLAISFADLEDFIIPDSFIVLGLINRIVFIGLSSDIKGAAISSIIGAFSITVPLILLVIVMEKILKREAMGGGDIKLVFMLGSYVSIAEGLLAVLISCVVGIVFAVISKRTNEQFPFGPSLCIGYLVSMLYGSVLIDSYLSLF